MLEHMAHIYNLANRDYMTQLYNRRYFFTQGKQFYLSAKENNSPLTVCMMDIDHFKQVNDNYGHDCGDIVLIYFSKILTDHFNEHLVARLGGEEFAVLFNNLEHKNVLQLLDKFRLMIEHSSVDCEEETLTITVSIGATDAYGEDIDAMLKLADDNLYQAKETGRNQVIG